MNMIDQWFDEVRFLQELLSKLEENVIEFFKAWPDSVYVQCLNGGFERMMMHGVCQYLDLLSKSKTLKVLVSSGFFTAVIFTSVLKIVISTNIEVKFFHSLNTCTIICSKIFRRSEVLSCIAFQYLKIVRETLT